MISLRVHGVPASKGSKNLGRNRRTGAPIMYESARGLPAWSAAVVKATAAARPVMIPARTPTRVTIIFYMPRPKSHYGTGRNSCRLKPSAPTWYTSKPDIDKLVRATYDGLTVGKAWADDAQVCSETTDQRYVPEGESPGALIIISTLTD